MSPETAEATQQLSPLIEDWKLRHTRDIQGGIEDWKIRHAETLAHENRRIDPTLSVDPEQRDNIGLRAVKSFANALILRELEKARPTTSIVSGLTVLQETFEAIGPVPDDPTFGEKVVFLPKFIAASWSVWFKNKIRAIRGEPTTEDLRIAKLKQIRGTWEADVPPAETGLEKGVDIAAGLSAFILQLAVAKRVVPASLGTGRLANALAWELTNTEGLPGQGALMGSTLMAMHEIRLAGSISRTAEITATSALFAATAAAQGAELEDVIISALIPPALASIGVLNRKLRSRIRMSRDARFLERHMRTDALKVLGLSPKPTLAEVKTAFRNLVKAAHPDISPSKSAATQTQQIIEAYHFLTGQGKYAPTARARKTATPKPPKPEPTPEPTTAVARIKAPVPAVTPTAPARPPQVAPVPAEAPTVPTAPAAPPVTPLSQQVPAEVSPRAKTRSLDLQRWYDGEPIEVTPAKLLYYALTHEARGARIGYRSGQLDMTADNREMIDFAKKNLPDHEQKLVARALEKIAKSRTPAQRKAVIRSINLMVKSYERSAAVKEFKEVMKTAKKKGLLPEFQEQVDAITEEFSVVKRTARIRQRFESVIKAAQIDELHEIPQKLVERAREALAKATKPLLRDMPAEDIRMIAQAIQAVAAQSAQKKLFINKGKYRDIAKRTQETAAEVAKWHPSKPTGAPGEFSELESTQIPVLRMLTWDELALDVTTELVFGETGTGRDLTFGNIKTSQRDYLRLLQQIEDMVAKTIAEQEITVEMLTRWSNAYGKPGSLIKLGFRAVTGRGKPDILTIDTPGATTRAGVPVPSIQMTTAELMEFYNFLQDPQNRAALIRNKQDGILYDRDPSAEPVKFTIQDVANIESKMRENPQALALADTFFEIVNGPLRDDVNITSMAEFLIDIWPRTNSWSRRRSDEFTHKDPNKVIEQHKVLMFENMGIFQQRTGGNEPFRIGDIFSTFYAHLSKGAGYAHKTRAVHDALRLMGEREVVQAIRHGFKHGDDRIASIKKAIRAYQGEGIIEDSRMSRFLNGILQRGQQALIGGKGHIIVFQGVSFLNALNEIEAKWLFPAMIKVLVSPSTKSEIEAKMYANSPPLRARIDGSGRQILSPVMASPSMQRFFGKPSGLLERGTLGPIHWGDGIVIDAIALAVETELAATKGLSGQPLLDATALRAEDIIDKTQPTWDPMTISTLALHARENPFIKIFGLMFSSQRSKNLQQVVRGTIRFKRSKKTRADWERLIKAWTIPTIVSAIALVAITKGKNRLIKAFWRIFGVGKYEPEKDAVDVWLDWAQQVNDRLWGTLLLGGQIPSEATRAVIRGAMQDPANLSPRTNIITATAIKASDTLEDVIRGASEIAEGETEKGQALLIKGLDKSLSIIGFAAGFPYDGLSELAGPKIKELTTKPEN